MAEPRHHRLGLGAQPKPPDVMSTATNGFSTNGKKKYIPKPGDQPRRAEEELKVRTLNFVKNYAKFMQKYAI
jgi:hypothetical protein